MLENVNAPPKMKNTPIALNEIEIISGDKVEVFDQRVSVCRDHAKGACRRQQCKYYHIPVVIPPANVMATMHNKGNNNNNHTSNNNSNSNNNNNSSTTNTTTSQ